MNTNKTASSAHRSTCVSSNGSGDGSSTPLACVSVQACVWASAHRMYMWNEMWRKGSQLSRNIKSRYIGKKTAFSCKPLHSPCGSVRSLYEIRKARAPAISIPAISTQYKYLWIFFFVGCLSLFFRQFNFTRVSVFVCVCTEYWCALQQFVSPYIRKWV